MRPNTRHPTPKVEEVGVGDPKQSPKPKKPATRSSGENLKAIFQVCFLMILRKPVVG